MIFYPLQHKIVVLLAEELPMGLAMNALSVIGVSLGKDVSGLVGRDLFSQDGMRYRGVVTTPLPILKAPQDRLDGILNDFRERTGATSRCFATARAMRCVVGPKGTNAGRSSPSDG